MRKLLSFAILILHTISVLSQVVYEDKNQRWEVSKIVSDQQYTAVYCDIYILSNRAGCFEAHEDDRTAEIFLYGTWGRSELVATDFSGDYKAYSFIRHGIPDQTYYKRGNSGNMAKGVFYFTRIPAGISTVNWYCDGGWALESAPCDQYHCAKFKAFNLPIIGNLNTTPQTSYSEKSLKQYWSNNKCLPIEGVYSFINTTSSLFWGKNRHRLAIKKADDEYEIIYISGANEEVWKEGELKGICSATTTKGLYKVDTWYNDNKMLATADFYIEYNKKLITIHDAKTGVETQFAKLFPINEIEDEDSAQSAQKGSNTQAEPSGNGSGFFVSGNIVATNYHVIDGAKEIEVVIQTEQQIKKFSAKVLNVDKINDLALLSIEDSEFKPHSSIPYELTSRSLEVGSSIFTMGFPMENVMGSEIKVTDGIISSKTGYQGTISTYQISAPIQPGNSGGPMFSKDGKLVGVTSSGIPGAENVGYAIKTSYLNNLIEAAPILITDISNNTLKNKDLPEQIKIIAPYVVLIYIYL